ncbi:MAG: Smr/MutS family protein [Roseovarius sp.]|nr:Smr/MutS family protein [Roseovarius sp.]
MSDRKSKCLTTEDVNLWHEVAATIDRKHDQKKVARPAKEVKRRLPETKASIKKGTKNSQEAKIEHLGYANRGDVAAVGKKPRSNIHMDRKKYGRMIRGNMTPEKTIDLHGFRQDHAKKVLADFILKSHQNQNRLLLVITGKGRNDNCDHFNAEEAGVLRRAVPQWLEDPKLADVVLQIAQAHRKHGGSGAYYIYLKRRRL